MSDVWLRIRNHRYVLAVELLVKLAAFIATAALAIGLSFTTFLHPRTSDFWPYQFACLAALWVATRILKSMLIPPAAPGIAQEGKVLQDIEDMRTVRQSWRA